MSQDIFQPIAIFQSSYVTEDGDVVAVTQDQVDDHVAEKQLSTAHQRIASLLPINHIELTTAEAEKVRIYQQARLVLGAAGAAPMICKGDDCPVHETCPLFAMSKHPMNQQCPFESNYVADRFLNWMIELKRTLETLTESERAVISNLVYLDLQECRMIANLSKAQNAMMESRSVRDIDVETGNPICWEDVVAISKQNLSSITVERRMLMKDFELTPEQKTKRKRWLGERDDNDIARRQSAAHDRIRKKRQQLITIEAPAKI